VKSEAPLLNRDRLRKLGVVLGVSAAHLLVFSVMGRTGEPARPPVPASPIEVFLFRPPPPPSPPSVQAARLPGGTAPAAPSRIHLPPKPADRLPERPAPPVQASEPALVVGQAPVAGPIPAMGQGGAGVGTGSGDGNGSGSGGIGPMILRPATSAEIESVAPPPVRGRRRPAGRVVVNCVIRTDQRLDDCRIVEESPRGFGFGEQALRATAFFRFRPPMTAAGRPIEGQRVTTFVSMGGRDGR
jgi:protein TonB